MKTGKHRVILSKNDIKVLRLLQSNPEGLRVKLVIKMLGLPQRTVYNRLHKLERVKIIKHINPIWKIASPTALSDKLAKSLKGDKIQQHKFSFICKLIRKPKWWAKRGNQLETFGLSNSNHLWSKNNSYQQFFHDSILIQTYSNSIIYINQKYYWGNDPYDCFIQSLEDVLKAHCYLEDRIRFQFTMQGIPHFSVRSQHYVKLRDALARKCKKEGNMIKVEIDNKLRAWVDLSDPRGTEFGHKDYAPEDTTKYSNFIKDIIENDAPIMTQIAQRQNFIEEQVINVTKNQGVFDSNMQSHLDVLNRIGLAVDELRKEIKKIKNK